MDEEIKDLNRIGGFVEGNNRLAFWIAKNIISGNLSHNYCPVLFYGSSGSGKTLLLKSIEAALRQKFPMKKIICWDCESFVNSFLQRLNSKSTYDDTLSEFKKQNKNAEIFIIDDIDFLVNKNASLEMFFQIFNAIYHQGMIICSSHILPKNMNISMRYKSRLSSGLLVEMEKPDAVTKKKILQNIAVEKGLTIDSHIIEYVATHIQNPGALSGALCKIASLEKQEQLNIAKVKDILSDLIIPKTLTIENIVEVITGYYKVSSDLLLGKTRSHDVSLIRQLIMYVALDKVPGASFQNVGELLNRDRSTVVYGVRVIKQLLNSESEEGEYIRTDLKNILEKLKMLNYDV